MEENQSFLELQVDREGSENLTDAMRWGKWLGLMILVAMGLMLLAVILLGRQLAAAFLTSGELTGSTGDAFVIGLVIGVAFVAAIIGVLMSFLVKAASRIRNGIINKDQFLFNSGLTSLKNYFVMYGVLVILRLVLVMLTLAFK